MAQRRAIRSRPILRWLVRLLAAGAIAYVCGLALLIFTARDMIYPFATGLDATKAGGIPGARVEVIDGADGTPLVVWLSPPQGDRPLILYFMGNAGSLHHNAPRLADFAYRGFGVAAMNYRGAGGQPGTPSESALTQDALTLYDAMAARMDHPLVIMGTSLGAAIAVNLAAQRPARALILETPFNRLCEVAELRFPIYPACLVLPYERWPSADRIGSVKAPILIQHGDRDRTIPLAQARALYRAAPDPKRLVVYPGARHNDLRLHGAGTDVIAFLENL